MIKGLHRRALALSACLGCAVLASGAAGACELVQTKWGNYIGIDCYLDDHITAVRQANLRPKNFHTTLTGVAVSVSTFAKNYGSVGTEGLFSLSVPVIGGGANQPQGRFDIDLHVEVRELNGNVVEVYEPVSGSKAFQTLFRHRSDRLDAGEERGYYMGDIELPDRAQNYDVCLSVRVDSRTSASPGGEVWESDEADNTRRGSVRIYPAAGSDVDPDQLTPSACDLD